MKPIYFILIFTTVILFYALFQFRYHQNCEVKDKWGLYTDTACLTENKLISDGFFYDNSFNWFMLVKKDTILIYEPLDRNKPDDKYNLKQGSFNLNREIDSLNVIKILDENNFTVISKWQIDTSQAAINANIFNRRIFEIKEMLSGEIYMVGWLPNRGISIVKYYK